MKTKPVVFLSLYIMVGTSIYQLNKHVFQVVITVKKFRHTLLYDPTYDASEDTIDESGEAGTQSDEDEGNQSDEDAGSQIDDDAGNQKKDDEGNNLKDNDEKNLQD